MIGFTLTSLNGLKEKWLFDHTKSIKTADRKAQKTSASDDGDLIKAGFKATAIRAKYPDAKFVVWLCTNRRLNDALQQPVYDKASELGIDVRFLEQSQLRDFLDVNPEGQWLRQEHLGILADRMSESLLRNLSLESLDLYANDLLLPPTNQIVTTRAAKLANDALLGTASLFFLVGPSGAGKSVIAHHMLRCHIDGGGIGLWIRGEVADKESSLAGAVEVVLRSLHPHSGIGSGYEALKIGTADKPFLLIVDDANRMPHPVQLINKVIGWSRAGNPTDDRPTQVTKSPVRVVCPAWDAFSYPFLLPSKSMNWVGVQMIGPMIRPESLECLKSAIGECVVSYSDSELDGFAERLNDDPILLGIFGILIQTDPALNPFAIVENVIGSMTDRAIKELATSMNIPPEDYHSTLKYLSLEMIRRKVLHPNWEVAKGWFNHDHTIRSLLMDLVAQKHVCRLTAISAESRLEFRHDRILEYHLSQAASVMLIGESDDKEAVADPFFTTFVGRAIARFEPPIGVLEWVRLKNPAALIASLQFLSTSQSEHADRIVQLARSWLSQAEDFPESMRLDALWTLARTNSPRVLDVTEGIPGNQRVWEARLRNGDASAGALALSREFKPAVQHPWLKSLIEEARTHHGPRLTENLRSLLRSKEICDQQRYGALCLAGYLGDPSLASDVKFAWENAGDQRYILLAGLWAGFRCAGKSPSELVDPMMLNILTLQHDDSGSSVDERGEILMCLRFASRHGFGEPVLNYLVDLGDAREEFRWIVASILEDIDHPIAIRFLVRLLGEAKYMAALNGGFSPWALSLSDRWKRMEKGNEAYLSTGSIAALRLLWDDEQNPEWLQNYAFYVWAQIVEDPSELALVSSKSRHYAIAVWQRALRGDRAVVEYVLSKIHIDARWFHVVPHVWGSEFEHAIEAALGVLAADPNAKEKPWSYEQYLITRLLRDIPTEPAERLLVKNWGALGQFPLFIQAALYHGTPKCIELAAASLTEVEDSVEPFRFIEFFFGFTTLGLMDRLTPRHLNTLLPYIRRLDAFSLDKMLEWCGRFDHWSWAINHLESEIRRRDQLSNTAIEVCPPFILRSSKLWFPTDEDLLVKLDRIESIDHRFRLGHFSHWWDQFIERRDPDERPGRVLIQWLDLNPSPERFVVSAKLVGERGKRRDFQTLLKLNPAGENPETIRAVADAEFAVKRRTLD